MRKIELILVLMVLVVSQSCQEVFYNDDLRADEKIPVVDARITSFTDHQFVKLYYARPYNQDGYDEISGAIVRVLDDQGNTFNFNEIYTGYYQTERGYLVGLPGATYTLVIDLPDGTVIQSAPQVMPDTIGIENLQYPIMEQEVVRKEANGDESLITTTGYSYQITPRQPTDKHVYYRLKSDFYVYANRSEIEESEIEFDHDSGDSIISARVVENRLYDCYESFSDQELPIIGELNPDVKLNPDERTIQTQFLAKDYNYYTDYEFVEWIVMADVYSISQVAFQYYTALNEQLTAPNRIFDPIPNQLTGNMYCSSDTNIKVLGLFDVTAKSRRYNGLYKYISHGIVSIQSRFYPDSIVYSTGCKLVKTTRDTIITGIRPVE